MPLRYLRPVTVAALAALVTGCFMSEPAVQELAGHSSLGPYQLNWQPEQAALSTGQLQQALEMRIEQLADELLASDDASPIARFNALQVGDCLALPLSLNDLLARLLALDASVQAELSEAGVEPVYWWLRDADGQPLRGTQSLAQAITLRDGLLCRRQPVRLQLATLASSYAIDVLVDWLLATGIENFMLDLGGDVRVSGEHASGRPWRIVLEAPRDEVSLAYRLFELEGYAFARAGDYRAAGLPARSPGPVPVPGVSGQGELGCVSVFAETATEADAIAHLLMSLGAEAGWQFAATHGVPAFFVQKHGAQGFISRGSPAFNVLNNSEE